MYSNDEMVWAVKCALAEMVASVKANPVSRAPGRLGPILNTPNAGNAMPRPNANDEGEGEGWYANWWAGGRREPIYTPQRYSRQGPINLNPVYYADSMRTRLPAPTWVQYRGKPPLPSPNNRYRGRF